MSAIITTQLECDQCGENSAYVTGPTAYVTSLREDVLDDGWRRKRGKDLCPSCAKVCRACNGSGEIGDYEGLEMRPVGVECLDCNGSGKV